MKRKTKFENDKNCLEANQHDNERNHLEKNKIDTDHIKESHKEFIKINKSVLKTQPKFKSAEHNVFTKEINKIGLSSNNDKRMQSIDLIETYAYGTNKDLVSEKEEMYQCNNITK